MNEYHGHLTHKDGSHTALTKEEADALWKSVEKAEARDAVAMPEAWDATRAIIRAKQRLQRLGWWEGGGLRLKGGDECAVMEYGSTGIWSGWIDEDRKYVHYCDSVSSPRKVLLKPLDQLTDAERAKMSECDADQAEYMQHECARWSAMAEQDIANTVETPHDIEEQAPE